MRARRGGGRGALAEAQFTRHHAQREHTRRLAHHRACARIGAQSAPNATTPLFANAPSRKSFLLIDLIKSILARVSLGEILRRFVDQPPSYLSGRGLRPIRHTFGPSSRSRFAVVLDLGAGTGLVQVVLDLVLDRFHWWLPPSSTHRRSTPEKRTISKPPGSLRADTIGRYQFFLFSLLLPPARPCLSPEIPPRRTRGRRCRQGRLPTAVLETVVCTGGQLPSCPSKLLSKKCFLKKWN